MVEILKPLERVRFNRDKWIIRQQSANSENEDTLALHTNAESALRDSE
jgi:hypothetical protein